jgi:hypothetical protein
MSKGEPQAKRSHHRPLPAVDAEKVLPALEESNNALMENGLVPRLVEESVRFSEELAQQSFPRLPQAPRGDEDAMEAGSSGAEEEINAASPLEAAADSDCEPNLSDAMGDEEEEADDDEDDDDAAEYFSDVRALAVPRSLALPLPSPSFSVPQLPDLRLGFRLRGPRRSPSRWCCELPVAACRRCGSPWRRTCLTSKRWRTSATTRRWLWAPTSSGKRNGPLPRCAKIVMPS